MGMLPLESSRASIRPLIMLRWGATLFALVAVLYLQKIEGPATPFTMLMFLVGIHATSNMGLWLWRRSSRDLGPRAFGAILSLDTCLLTAILALTGGPGNPFTVFYLVQVALAAVVLGTRWTWLMAVMSSLSFGLLFVFTPPSSASHMHPTTTEAVGFFSHLQGMWVAYTITAGLLAFFLVRITESLRNAERAASRYHELALKTAHLAELTTLAAGAAHELGTPLGTIYMVSKELALDPLVGAHPHLTEDVALIREETKRCRGILDGMRPLGEASGEKPLFVPFEGLWEEIQRLFEGRKGVTLQLRGTLPEAGFYIPRTSLVQTLTALIQNGLDASPADKPITLEVRRDEKWVRISVIDHGCGLSPALINRAAAPFLSTKEEGRGMGLGLFLAHTFAAQMGGQLLIESELGLGSTFTLILPVESPLKQ